jgi:hypothetical protein
MDLLRHSVALAALSLCPICAGAQTPNASNSPCTLTLAISPTHPQVRSIEPVVFVDMTQTYTIRSFRLQQSTVAGNPMSATVVASMEMEPTLATLLDQHAIIERADLACPSKKATLANATIGFIGSFAAHANGDPGTLSFTMNFRSTGLQYGSL